MAKYILLAPLAPDMFGLQEHDELLEAVNEFGCDLLVSHFPNGDYVAFATASKQETLTNMTTTVELPGIVLEYTAVFDQVSYES